MAERSIILNGFSKAFAMTGLRVGYTIAPPDVTAAMLKIHQYSMLCAPITAQIGALEALKNGEDEIENVRAEYNEKGEIIGIEIHRAKELIVPEILKFIESVKSLKV